MKILVVGQGGREHTFVWKIAQSPRVTKLYAAPGNPGIASLAECVDIGAEDIGALVGFAEAKKIDLVVVGPEVPLAKGLVDRLTERGVWAFGPTQAAARIESDKDFALELMHKYGIPTARYETFTEPGPAGACVKGWGAPMWLKASGLAAGKGAIFCETADEALKTIDEVMVQRVFGGAGDKLVVMEHMVGEEASIFGFTDGEHMVGISPSQDHKAVGEGDTGLNTGGMGAYAPAPVVTPERQKEIFDRVMMPTVKALAEEGCPYTGFLYGGIIFTDEGPKVIEFNCRMGDPETQVVLPLMKTDLVDVIAAARDGSLSGLKVELDDRAATCVVVASGGYPVKHETGFPITGLDHAEELDDVVVFHAGTAEVDGKVVTNGGRVLGVTAMGDTIKASIDRAYEAVDRIDFEGMYCRRDIGHRALARL
jgi:phosphoribosylamine---glycine ligase